MDHRKGYLGELKTLMSKKGGNMFTGYIQKIRDSAIASVPEKDRASLQYLMGDVKSIDISKLPKAKGPAVVWSVGSALKILKEEPLTGRSLANGKKMFSAGLCVACHRFGAEGGEQRVVVGVSLLSYEGTATAVGVDALGCCAET